MKYTNPVVRGFYPDPSVCSAEGRYYLVASSFQYFPGVPLFESEDLVNWKQIGHVLTRPSQVMLDKVRSSGGVFAPTIRYNDGRFYMVTNNNSTNENFYVYTDDIYGEWSDPVIVDQGGIDPSLYFEDGHTYFISNGQDAHGKNGIIQCEIDIATGKKLSESVCIWTGAGGRYIESPHMYRIREYYYLIVAEGGTEYGHMIAYSRSTSVWGPFENYPGNPVLTNRNKAPYTLQGIGHGDLICKDSEWFMLCLGFRQIHLWEPYHHLGREIFLTPVQWTDDGWFTCGNDGTTDWEYEIAGDGMQERKNLYTFNNTDWNLDWCYLRKPNPANYEFPAENQVVLTGCNLTLEDVDSPTFLGIRQVDFDMTLTCDIAIKTTSGPADVHDQTANVQNNYIQQVNSDTISDHSSSKNSIRPAAGITIYMCENEHYDLLIRPRTGSTDTNTDNDSGKTLDGTAAYEAVLRLNIGDIKHEQCCVLISDPHTTFKITSDPLEYHFSIIHDGQETVLGSARSKYLSSEVSSGFTGVMIGLFAEGNIRGTFTNYSCSYHC